jgi:lipoprotein-anchoring transpeptidase ErfK/SrfK
LFLTKQTALRAGDLSGTPFYADDRRLQLIVLFMRLLLAAFLSCTALLASNTARAESTLDLLFKAQQSAQTEAVLPPALTSATLAEPAIMIEPALDADADGVPVKKGKKKGASKDGSKFEGRIASGGGRPEIVPREPKIVALKTREAPGTVIINTSGRELFFVKGDGLAYRYRIAVGKQGFSWAGTETISSVTDWPDWYPPKEMRERKPELPEKMEGGVKNPLGAKAIYLGNTLYRIHGTNEPKSIGRAASSGCFRMNNSDVVHLASMVSIGSKVMVIDSFKNMKPRAAAVAGTVKVKSASRKAKRKIASAKTEPAAVLETPLPARAE